MQDYKSLPRKPNFTAAENKSFLTNFFTINIISEETNFYQYYFDCDPQVPQDSTQLLEKLIQNIFPVLKKKIGLLSVRGNNLYGSKDVPFTEEVSFYKGEKEQKKFAILIKQTKEIPLKELLLSSKQNEKMLAYQVINISTKEKLKKMNMIELSQGKFYKKVSLLDNDFKNGFYAMKGYKFTTCPLNSGLYIQIDVFSRLIRQRSLLQEINHMKSKDVIKSELEGAIVIARYGNYRTYEIKEVDFNSSPLSKFIPRNQEESITYKQFYKSLYGKQIVDLRQPLILSVSKVQKFMKKGGGTQKNINYVYLIPQLVSLVGLSDEHRKDGSLMRDIISRTQYSAQNRLKEIQSIAEELNNQEGGLYKIGSTKRMNGFKLQQPKILADKLFSAKNGEIKLTHELIKEPAKFDNWYLVYTERYNEEAESLEDVIFEASKTFGIKFSQPIRFNMGKQNNPQEYKKEINLEIKESKKNPQVILFLVGNFHKENFYREMKSFCTLQLKVPSQFITIQKLSGQKKKHGGLMSLASNLILQMNIKIGKVLWEVPVRNANLQKKKIICGAIAISKINKQYYLGFVGTTNDKLTKVYSQTKSKKRLQDFDQNLLSEMFINWIKQYFLMNNRAYLPEVIIFYREGISHSQLSSSSMKQIAALKQMIEKAKIKTKTPNFSPQIVYFTVNKNSTSRYYEDSLNHQKFSPKFVNPSSGSVVMEEMSQQGYNNFHMTPHPVNVMTTSTPSQYNLCYQEPKKVLKDALVQFTFEQCFNYYNWKGAIKFPACLQNANKLSKLAGKSLKEEITPDNKMNLTFHFL